MKTSKPAFGILTGLLLFGSSVHATEQPWQRMSFPTAAAVAAEMRSPLPEYGPAITFGWDGPVTRDALVRDFDALQERGFRIVTLEAGYNMDTTPYLSEAWFEMIGFAVGLARERGMRVIVIDEGKYPSGFAGGLFSEQRPDLRMQGIAISDTIAVTPGETLDRAVDGRVIGALAVNRDDGSHQRVAVKDGRLTWTAPGAGSWDLHLVDHDFRTPVTRAVNDPTRAKTTANSMGDLLNPEAVKQFIEWTHAAYHRHLGDEFGKTIIAFRGDEPDFAHIPFTTEIFERFRELKGYDVTPYVTAWAPLPTREGERQARQVTLTTEEQRAKADYWDVWSQLFADAFFAQQAEWCEAHGVEHTTHLNNEHRMERLVASTGDFFRAMRSVQIPGVDTIWNQVWPGRNADFIKLAGSAAHAYGRPRALSESYAAYNQPRPPNLAEARWGVDYQLVRGITLFEFMFYPSSSPSGEVRLRNYLGEDGFPALADYTNRAGYLLSQGRPVAKIGLYFPTLSLWLGDIASEERVMAVANSLLQQQRDFDFVDEQGLARDFNLDAGRFTNLSGQSYEAIIVPEVTAISQKALERLRQFAKQGGTVVFLGDLPDLAVGRSFMQAAPPTDLAWALREPSGELTGLVFDALPKPDVELNAPAPELAYQHRALKDADLYFFFNQGEERLERTVWLEGSGTPEIWSLQDGSVAPLDGFQVGSGRVRVPLSLLGWATTVLVLSRTGPSAP